MKNKEVDIINEVDCCRVCGGSFVSAINLGKIFPSSFIKKNEIMDEKGKAPLELVECVECGLVQLKHTIDLDLMYRQYWYSSSLNKSMVSSLLDVVEDSLRRVVLLEEDTVIDIGCNDGTMLNMYPEYLNKIGFDPALNLDRSGSFEFINDYFSASAVSGETKAKIITAIAMFYDLPDPVGFANDVREVLHKDGIFIVQFTDLISMLKSTAFDNICHEHLEYYRLQDVLNVLEAAGLSIIDVSHNDVNGGSIRITASHKGRYVPSTSVLEELSLEKEFLKAYGFDEFRKKVATIKMKTTGFLKWALDKGDTVHLLGASTKGNTLLQVFEIDNSLVKFAAEVNSDKFGLMTVGSNIEIISETDSLIKHPDHYLVPVWHFKASILKNEKILDYLNSGGSLVFPLPEFIVITMGCAGNLVETRI